MFYGCYEYNLSAAYSGADGDYQLNFAEVRMAPKTFEIHMSLSSIDLLGVTIPIPIVSNSGLSTALSVVEMRLVNADTGQIFKTVYPPKEDDDSWYAFDDTIKSYDFEGETFSGYIQHRIMALFENRLEQRRSVPKFASALSIRPADLETRSEVAGISRELIGLAISLSHAERVDKEKSHEPQNLLLLPWITLNTLAALMFFMQSASAADSYDRLQTLQPDRENRDDVLHHRGGHRHGRPVRLAAEREVLPRIPGKRASTAAITCARMEPRATPSLRSSCLEFSTRCIWRLTPAWAGTTGSTGVGKSPISCSGP